MGIRNWLVAVIMAAVCPAMTDSYTPQPAEDTEAESAGETEARVEALRRQIERETAEQAAIYENMSDDERMRGIVYEPVGRDDE